MNNILLHSGERVQYYFSQGNFFPWTSFSSFPVCTAWSLADVPQAQIFHGLNTLILWHSRTVLEEDHHNSNMPCLSTYCDIKTMGKEHPNYCFSPGSQGSWLLMVFHRDHKSSVLQTELCCYLELSLWCLGNRSWNISCQCTQCPSLKMMGKVSSHSQPQWPIAVHKAMLKWRNCFLAMLLPTWAI